MASSSLLRIALLVATASMFACACTNQAAKTATPPTPGVNLKFQAPILEFQPAEVTELYLTQNDPQLNNHWSARFARAQGGEWEIATAPDGTNFTDRLANTKFIDHLLSTLTTLVWSEKSPQGNLESVGLSDPQYELRILGKNRDITLRLGTLLSDGVQRYAQIKGYEASLIVRGASLKMLEFIKSFEILRLPTILTFDGDFVDDLEVFENGKSLVYAQRNNDDWSDKNLKPVPFMISDYVEYLTHLRILNYVDQVERAHEIAKKIGKKSIWHMKFHDRKANQVDLHIGKFKDGKAYAVTTDRPDVAFELFPETMARLKPKLVVPQR